jgi:hypothetical protein
MSYEINRFIRHCEALADTMSLIERLNDSPAYPLDNLQSIPHDIRITLGILSTRNPYVRLDSHIKDNHVTFRAVLRNNKLGDRILQRRKEP